MSIAAPAPWTARAAISQPMPGASAEPADATVNSAIPATNSRRRPNLSPSAAAVISSTARLSVYALTIHSSWPRDAPRLCRIVVSAVVTTSTSRPTMNAATDVSASTHRCDGVEETLLLLGT